MVVVVARQTPEGAGVHYTAIDCDPTDDVKVPYSRSPLWRIPTAAVS